MSIAVRRVVTGHDGNGKAVVLFDNVLDSNDAFGRAGVEVRLIWSTDGFPVDNGEDLDRSQVAVGNTLPNGSVFRVIAYAPGKSPRNHRTESIDYAVVISGEIDLQLDDETVHLTAGDVLVQRGTIHNWVNNGSEPCVVAFVLIGAIPMSIDHRTLSAQG